MGVDDQRVKHLELVQAVITRLGQNSFAVRGWSVTLVSVLFALIASKDAPPPAALIALVPTVVFWGLDAYYLRQERLFRKLYGAVAKDVAGGTSTVPVFAMDPSPYLGVTPSWAATLVSRTVLPIPVVLAVIAVGYVAAASVR
jgi:hypothetical protein